jgi:hypothetical protein
MICVFAARFLAVWVSTREPTQSLETGTHY